jgi:hypothetical protein
MMAYECEKIVRKLKIDDASLKHHHSEITARLDTATLVLTTRTGNPLSQHKIFGINQCLHLAGTLVLLESHSQSLRQLLEELSSGPKPPKPDQVLPESDATSFLSAAMLCYLLTTYLPRMGVYKPYDVIWAALDSVNWIVGEKDMKLLGIPHSKTVPMSPEPLPTPGPSS